MHLKKFYVIDSEALQIRFTFHREKTFGDEMSAKFVSIFNFFSLSLLRKTWIDFNAPHEAVFFLQLESRAIYYSHRLELLFLFLSYYSMAPNKIVPFPLSHFFMTHDFFLFAVCKNFPGLVFIRRIFSNSKKILHKIFRGNNGENFHDFRLVTTLSETASPAHRTTKVVGENVRLLFKMAHIM